MRVVLEVEREKLIETLKFIRDVFSEAQIERIEHVSYKEKDKRTFCEEKDIFRVAFRVELTAMTIIDTLDFYKKLDLLKLMERV